MILTLFPAESQAWPANTATVKPVNPGDHQVLYFGSWTMTPVVGAPGRRQTDDPYAACEIVFRGTSVRWLGGKGPGHGWAEVFVDGQSVDTIDAYAPEVRSAQVLFEKDGLPDDRLHTLRIVVLRDRDPKATGHRQSIDGFEVSEIVDYPRELRERALAELGAIALGEKPYLGPDEWRPEPFVAEAPERNVELTGGVLRQAFERNIAYILESAANPPANNFWVNALPASSEGRVLGAAAHSLRWEEREDLRAIVNELVDSVSRRQKPDGYCLPYDIEFMHPQAEPYPGEDERRNYDRTNLTRGMVAAGKAGNEAALPVMRKFYDWLNASDIYPTLLTGSYDGSAHNCNNGHPGGLLMYFSPAGKPEDLLSLERYFVQDFFIEEMKRAEPLALDYYPFHVPHSYVLLAFGAWLDHYRATGHPKYLEAALGAWEVVHRYYEHIGGTIAICEEEAGAYSPQSYHLRKHTGETCGTVFWTDINHRLLRHFPNRERYAAEIEKSIYNVILAAQDSAGAIRYHNHLHGRKQAPQHVNTCCEVNGTPFIARLPEFLYSIDENGLWVNLFAASSIRWTHRGEPVELVARTAFPFENDVEYRLAAASASEMSMHIRIPGWAARPVEVAVNGSVIATGEPGTYVTIRRVWRAGDRIALELPMQFRLDKYTGLDQHPERDRYALSYGPILMAVVGARELDFTPAELMEKLIPIEGKPLHFNLPGEEEWYFQPYWTLDRERMTCFPVLK